VITLKGEDTPRYAGQRLADAAIMQEVFGEGHVGKVWGFCR
jgi:hypothetical protein